MSDQDRRDELSEHEYLTPAEAGFLIDRDKATLNRWIGRGLPAYRSEVTGQVFVKAAELHPWIADPANKVRQKPPATPKQ